MEISNLGFPTSLASNMGDVTSPLFCTSCLSKLEILINPPVTGFHESVANRLRAGFNTPVSSGELAQINAFLVGVPANHAGYNKAIVEIERLLAKLKNARDGLQRRSDNARSLISSHIRKLPLDVLNEVFTFCCLRDVDSDGIGYSLSLKKGSLISYMALKLSWVCSFWRAAIRSCPYLWSSLRLSTWVFQTQPRSFRILLEYLSFAGGSPLDVHFTVENTALWASLKVPEVTGTLLGNSMRCRRAALNIPKVGAKQWFAYVADRLAAKAAAEPRRAQLGHFPILEYLKIPDDIPWSDGLLEFLRSLSICPRLRTFHGSHISWTRNNADFSHITELSLVSFIGKSLGHLLRRLPVLETLSLRAFQFSDDDDDGDDIWLEQIGYYSSSLSKLSVVTWNLGSDAWRFVRLPQLIEVTLVTPATATFPDEMPLSAVLLNSRSQLQSLELQLSCHIDQTLLNFVALHPSLVHLAVSSKNSDPVETLLTELGPKKDGSRLAPNLRSLKISCMFLREVESLCLAICELVESRCKVARSATGKLALSGLQILIIDLNWSDRRFQQSFLSLVHLRLFPLEQAGFSVKFRNESVLVQHVASYESS